MATTVTTTRRGLGCVTWFVIFLIVAAIAAGAYLGYEFVWPGVHWHHHNTSQLAAVPPTATATSTAVAPATITPTLASNQVLAPVHTATVPVWPPTATPSPTNTPAPTQTPMPTETPAPTQTPVPTNTPAFTPTVAPPPIETTVPTNTPAPTQTPIPTETPAPPQTVAVSIPIVDGNGNAITSGLQGLIVFNAEDNPIPVQVNSNGAIAYSGPMPKFGKFGILTLFRVGSNMSDTPRVMQPFIIQNGNVVLVNALSATPTDVLSKQTIVFTDDRTAGKYQQIIGWGCPLDGGADCAEIIAKASGLVPQELWPKVQCSGTDNWLPNPPGGFNVLYRADANDPTDRAFMVAVGQVTNTPAAGMGPGWSCLAGNDSQSAFVPARGANLYWRLPVNTPVPTPAGVIVVPQQTPEMQVTQMPSTGSAGPTEDQEVQQQQQPAAQQPTQPAPAQPAVLPTVVPTQAPPAQNAVSGCCPVSTQIVEPNTGGDNTPPPNF